MSSNYIANVPKLKGRENYDDWCFAAQNVLVLEGMASAIEKQLSQTASVTQKEEDSKAKAKLILTIDPSLYVHIKQASSTFDLWSILKKMFDDSGYTRKISLLRNLINIRLENCDSMTQYVTQIVETGQRLQGTGFKITDEWIGALMLAGLPEKYAPMIMAIEHSGIEVSADVIKTKLMDMCAERSAASGSDSAFIAKNKNVTKVIKCYKCKQTGHYKNQCPNTENSKRKQSNAFNAIFLSGKFNSDNWYIDSGASQHMTAKRNLVMNPSHQLETQEIVIANKTCVPVLCSGDVNIVTVVNDVEYDITVSNVLCIPSLTANLLSVSQLIDNGNKVIFKENVCHIYNRQNKLVGQAELEDGVYRLCTLKTEQIIAASAVASNETWHRRLGHINSASLNKMKNGAVEGISYPEKANIDKSSCTICCEGKQARLPFQQSSSKSDNMLEVIHADVCGPMENISIGGSRYYVLFVDDYTKMAFVYFMKTKNEALKYFIEFKDMAENQRDKKVKVLRTDNGGEFCSKEFEKYLTKQGIVHQKTNAYTPQQNGLCERMNRSVVEKARCLIFDAGLSKKFWAEAVNTSVYLRNRSVVTGLNNRTPYEVWTGEKPNLSHLRIFGSTVMVHVPKEKRLKWDKKSEKLIFVGYSENVKGYRVYDPIKNSVSTSRDIIIMETTENTVSVPVECKYIMDESIPEPEEVSGLDSSDTEEEKDTEKTYVPSEDTLASSSEDTFFDPEDSEVTLVDLTVPTPQTKRVRRKPERIGQTNLCIGECEVNSDNEISLKEALNGPESEQWKLAMQSELKSFKDNDAWELVDIPPNGTVVQCKWVFKRKFDCENNVRYRARLVAKGFTQRPGIDFDETFSPVLRHSTLRLLFALAVQLDLDISHLDVNTAFLNGFLNETVHMRKPLGFECSNDNENKVLLLKRAIYGLKQSSRAWYQRVDELLQSLGYKKSKLEPCLFTKITKDVKIIIALYVDDFFVFSSCSEETDRLKKNLASKFKLKDLGCIKNCLGMRVTVNKKEKCITIDQESYIEELLSKFNIPNCKFANTPIEPKINLTKSEVCDDRLPYQTLIGCLIYIAVLTRPDIVFAVNFLSQFNNCYNDEHWAYAKRVLKYLKGTKSYCLKFSANGNNKLEAYVDADWASNVIDRRSYTGYFFRLSNCAISWETRKQTTVALSSTEAEYMGISECCKEAVYLRNLVFEITNVMYTIPIFNDNQSAHKLSANPVYHKRSKHIDVRYHFCRENVANDIVKIKYLPTADMPADLLTKGLCKTKHYKFLSMLGLFDKK